MIKRLALVIMLVYVHSGWTEPHTGHSDDLLLLLKYKLEIRKYQDAYAKSNEKKWLTQQKQKLDLAMPLRAPLMSAV